MSDQKSIIALFEENELKISQLYDMYAQALPEHKDFWERISEEEIGHANAIAESFRSLGRQAEYFKENNFTRGIIKYVSDFVEQQILAAQKNILTHLEAINTALRVEQSMLERKCFEVFIPTDTSLKEVLNRLNQDTERHVNVLRSELKENQKKN